MTHQAAVETVSEFDFINYGVEVFERVREENERQWNPQSETETTATISEATPDPVTAELASLVNKAPTTTTMLTTLIDWASDKCVILPSGAVEILGVDGLDYLSDALDKSIDDALAEGGGSMPKEMLSNAKETMGDDTELLGMIAALFMGLATRYTKVITENDPEKAKVAAAAMSAVMAEESAPVVQVRKMPPRGNRKPN